MITHQPRRPYVMRPGSGPGEGRGGGWQALVNDDHKIRQ